MKPNTIVELPDGRRGTVCYHGLDGYGIVWGEQQLDVADLPPAEAMLRESYPWARDNGMECVGRDFTRTAELEER